MNKLLKSRNLQLVMVVFILTTILGIRLFSLTIIEKETWAKEAQALSVKNIYTPAPRGKIIDRYERVIATNKASFTVFFSSGELKSEEINKVSSDIIAVLEQNGDPYFDNFPIVLDENGEYVYTYDKEIQNWLVAEGMPLDYSAKQAFKELLVRNDISGDMDRFEAQQELQESFNVYPPISVKNMKYMKALDKESFLGRFKLDLDLTAEEAFAALRAKFDIEDTVSDVDARKIMLVRNEISLQGYRKYIPAKIAAGISPESIIILEEKSNSLPGVEVIAESQRYYPSGNTASHILGYLGKISENEKAYYKKKDYNPNDMVGQTGLEKTFESTLKGKDGTKNVQVNNLGELVKVISEEPPYKGKDLQLSVDLELQKSVEAYLKETLLKLQTGGVYESKWGNYSMPTYKNANVGAVVVLDAKTSDVLALASYPDYDPNLFAKGINNENWAALQPQNPRDTLAPRPLFNVATMAPTPPGSTFKMVTATAALESGWDAKKKLYDGGAVFLGRQPYGCLIWNNGGGSHGSLNLAQALEVSCNYYFYDLGAGKDFNKGVSLGLDPPMGVERMAFFAKEYGLGMPTGIEIAESIAPVPSQEQKFEKTKGLLKNYLYNNSENFFKAEVLEDKELLDKHTQTILNWTEENPSRTDLIDRMKNVGVKAGMEETVADDCKFSYFNQAKWTTGDELNISIGQGENAYTPLQMANYVATIGNKGVHNPVSLIKSIEGEGPYKKEEGKKISISDETHLTDIIEGMRRVVSGSRGSIKILNSAALPTAAKTGTAERDGKIPPPDEVEYVKTYLSRINSALTWETVEVEMKRLMREYPDTYVSQNGAVKKAVINLSGGKLSEEAYNYYKEDYGEYGWIVALAPYEEPEIAIAVLLVQGGSSTYAGPLVRDTINRYAELQAEYEANNNAKAN